MSLRKKSAFISFFFTLPLLYSTWIDCYDHLYPDCVSVLCCKTHCSTVSLQMDMGVDSRTMLTAWAVEPASAYSRTSAYQDRRIQNGMTPCSKPTLSPRPATCSSSLHVCRSFSQMSSKTLQRELGPSCPRNLTLSAGLITESSPASCPSAILDCKGGVAEGARNSVHLEACPP